MTPKIPDNLWPYRYEIVQNDMVHLSWIIALQLAMLAVYLVADSGNGRREHWFGFNVGLGLVIAGLFIRMETQIHRMGRFLQSIGDSREAFKTSDSALNLLPLGDILIGLLPLALLILSARRYWNFLRS